MHAAPAPDSSRERQPKTARRRAATESRAQPERPVSAAAPGPRRAVLSSGTSRARSSSRKRCSEVNAVPHVMTEAYRHFYVSTLLCAEHLRMGAAGGIVRGTRGGIRE